MEILEITKKYGVLIAEDAIEEIKNLSHEELKSLEKKISEEKPVFIDKKFVLSVKSPEIDVIEIKPKEKTLNLEEFVEILQNYYDTISDIIKKRMNPLKLVSISSIKEKEDYGIIGIVKSIQENENGVYIELEDKTGVIKCIIKKEFVKEDENTIYNDEVLGIEGKYDGNVMICDRVVFPDIEEVKQKKFEKETVIYARNDEESIRISINGKFYTVRNPAVFIIDDINILVFLNTQNINPKIYLKKRNLFPGKITITGIIQRTPDLVITTSNPGYREVYKGVKIVGLEPKEEIRIKLKNMEEIV